MIALAVTAGLWFGRGPSQPSPEPSSDLSEAAVLPDDRPITVHVSGAVAEPGLVSVPREARVADAVAAAGGALASARLDHLNLAASVRDGEQIVVPAAGNEQGAAGVVDDTRVRVNEASATGLEALPGVGPVLAARIAAYRDAHGPFATIEDLLDVPGIGEGKLAAIRDVAVVP